MTPLFLEYGYSSVNHVGEELCGDKVECITEGDKITLVLADGLGSGVKANILATLTSKILCTMISSGIDIDECIETVIQSLPVCKVRGVAYSTFSVIHVDKSGKGYLFEFDNPQAIYIHEGVCSDLERMELNILGKKVYRSDLALCEDDVIVTMSDGVIHAGVGAILDFGWNREEVKVQLDRVVKSGMSARCISCLLTAACNDLCLDEPGDDTTVAAVRVRKELHVNVMVGPPVDKSKDDFYIERFLSDGDKKVVCGGTSSQIVARYLNTDVKAELTTEDKEVPPIGHIDGIDLTTEGVLTLRKLLVLSEKYLSPNDLSPKYYKSRDGASLLADTLFEKATHVKFFVGQSINSAHQGLPIDITMKLKIVETLAANLRKMGKVVELFYD